MSVVQPGAVIAGLLADTLRAGQVGFVTTPQYAPRLRERLCPEEQLADDARERGWEREVHRHQRVAERIHGLAELGEPGGES
jgi:hypothetical protein